MPRGISTIKGILGGLEFLNILNIKREYTIFAAVV